MSKRGSGMVEEPTGLLVRGVISRRRRRVVNVANGDGTVQRKLVTYDVNCGTKLYEVAQWDPKDEDILPIGNENVSIPIATSIRQTGRGPVVCYQLPSERGGEEF